MVQETLNELFLPALGVISETFEQYDPVPFGLVEEDFIDFAANQFQKRIERIEGARGALPEEVHRSVQG